MFKRRRLISAGIAAAALVTGVIGPVSASHFRSSTDTFSIADGGADTTWVLDSAWAKGDADSFVYVGDTVEVRTAESTPRSGVGQNIFLESVDSTTDETNPLYSVTRETLTGDISGLANDDQYEIFADSCCRVDGVANAGDDSFSTWVTFTREADGDFDLPPAFNSPALYDILPPSGDTATFDFTATDPEAGAVTYSLISDTSSPWYGADELACSTFVGGTLSIGSSLCTDGDVFSEIYTEGSFWAAKIVAADALNNQRATNLLLRVSIAPSIEINETSGDETFDLEVVSTDPDTEQPTEWTIECTRDLDSSVVYTDTYSGAGPALFGFSPSGESGETFTCNATATNSAGEGTAQITSLTLTETVVPTTTVPPTTVPPTPDTTAPAPAPEPAPTTTVPAPTTTVPAPTTTVPRLDPVQPETPVAPGDDRVLENGKPVPVTVTPVPVQDNVIISGDGWKLTLQGSKDTNETPAGLLPDGRLLLETNRYATTSGEGFKPNTDVNVWLFSEPTFLGKLRTDNAGTFRGTLPIPANVKAGDHTLQVNGYTPNGTVRSASLGVVLVEKLTLSLVVRFDAASPEITKQTDAAIARFARRIKATGALKTEIRVDGYVQATTDPSNDKTLSTERARNVVKELRRDGIYGTYTVDGRGRATEKGPRARKVVITVSITR
jgi:outer membrane protein OmpA-like peptidoglycan-associated protein